MIACIEQQKPKRQCLDGECVKDATAFIGTLQLPIFQVPSVRGALVNKAPKEFLAHTELLLQYENATCRRAQLKLPYKPDSRLTP